MKSKKTDTKEQEPQTAPEIRILEFVTLPIDSILPNKYNPNRQSDHEFELLCRSIEEDGFTQPVLVQKDTMTIVDGEHRYRAMKALGYTEIPCALTDMPLEQAMVATLRHNRARGSEDIQKVADIFKDLKTQGAMDWMADSLMMDAADLRMMDGIEASQITLREEGMTFEEIQETLQKEQEINDLKAKENIQMAAADMDKITYQLTYVSDEAYLVKAVLGKNHAAAIVDLCRTARDQNLL
jgi:hypothetical protein